MKDRSPYQTKVMIRTPFCLYLKRSMTQQIILSHTFILPGILFSMRHSNSVRTYRTSNLSKRPYTPEMNSISGHVRKVCRHLADTSVAMCGTKLAIGVDDQIEGESRQTISGFPHPL